MQLPPVEDAAEQPAEGAPIAEAADEGGGEDAATQDGDEGADHAVESRKHSVDAPSKKLKKKSSVKPLVKQPHTHSKAIKKKTVKKSSRQKVKEGPKHKAKELPVSSTHHGAQSKATSLVVKDLPKAPPPWRAASKPKEVDPFSAQDSYNTSINVSTTFVEKMQAKMKQADQAASSSKAKSSQSTSMAKNKGGKCTTPSKHQAASSAASKKKRSSKMTAKVKPSKPRTKKKK